MAIGSRAWSALMRRNLVYRKRHFVSTAFELLLPVAFLGIILALKNAADIEDDDIVSAVRSVGFYEQLADFVALLMTLGFLYPAAAMIRYVVAEKAQRQKELLKMMSVTESDIGWSWFSSFFLFHTVSTIFLTLVSKKLYQDADMALLFLFWILALTSIIVLAMLVGSVFSRTPLATFVGLLVFFFGYFTTLAEDFATGDPTNLRLVSLHPMAAFSYAFREIGRLEDSGEGLTFSTMHETYYESEYTFAQILRYLFFDSVLWGTVTWYLNRVIPPSYGQPLPVYFLFLPSYWFPSIFRGSKVMDTNVSATTNDDPNIPVEPVTDATRLQASEGKSIEIHNLKKKFGDKVAIDELNLSFYNGQITALLGVNGAGKTTTINVLTGAVAPTEGTAFIAGKNIHSSMQEIRQDMGICLQHDCIFSSLTVREHIQLFCRIKGLYSKMSYKEAEEKVDQSLRDVALSDKSHSLANNLSGGMKRKLSVAMAFCGESPVVILDEPTSGMDPFSRRFTWDVIRRYRQGRTIILTTHFMDEADILGDKIAIMANGKLRCCGSSLYLKQKYGVGYQLSVEKGSRGDHPEQTMILKSGSDPDAEANLAGAKTRDEDDMLTDIVQGNITGSTVLSNAAGEMQFQLPMSSSHQFVSALTQLDSEVANGNIDSYGLSFTTLEEVFLIVSRGENGQQQETTEKESTALSLRGSTTLSNDDFDRNNLFYRHIRTLFMKRVLNFKRDRKAWLFTTILPSLLVFIGFLFFDSLDIMATWFLVTLSFPFITGAFGSFVVAEKQSKAKHLQHIAGVSPSAYWISSFLWDVLNYQFTLWITVILMFAFDIDDLTTTKHGVVGGVITLLFAFGPAAASFTYCTSFMFSSPAYCNVLNIVVGFLLGFGGTIVGFLLWFFGNGWNTASGGDDDFQGGLDPKDNLLKAATVLTWCLRIFPTFCLSNGLFYAINLGDGEDFIKGGDVTSVWDSQVLLYEVIFLGIQSILYLLLAIQIDKLNHNASAMRTWRKIVQTMTGRFLFSAETNVSYNIADDDDVTSEEERVKNSETSSDLIALNDLTKVYDNGKVAVNKLTLGIPAGECFGLLGTNGAGKTTTLGMLTTEFPSTSGDATLAGFSIRDEVHETRSRIGYCPQFDALLNNLTGREHVRLYAEIKGTPKKFIKQAVAEKLAAVGLSEIDSDRLASQYSGGMKRRLTLACATIGQPQLIFLDEPSTGVDPLGRREIWTMISNMLGDSTIPDSEKPCVVLTTHSMEECEALCSRIGIMAHGKLRCLGSAQHLKTKFGRGYQLEMKVRLPERNDADCNSYLLAMGRRKQGVNDTFIAEKPDEIFLNVQEVHSSLQALTGDGSLSEIVSAENAAGSVIYRDANSSPGVSLAQLAHFATSHMRMRKLDHFIASRYPKAVLRERQDTKTRYEISSEGLSIAHIFETVEANKESLAVAEYSASQTTLEEIFNFHAAQAEQALKNSTPN